VDGLWATKRGGVGLVVCAVSLRLPTYVVLIGLGHVRYLSHLGPPPDQFRYLLDHFGARNFKHLVTLTNICAAGQSTAGLMLCHVGNVLLICCLLDQWPEFESIVACSLNAASTQHVFCTTQVTCDCERHFTGMTCVTVAVFIEVCTLRAVEAIMHKIC